MIAPSHIGTTNATNGENSARSSARQDSASNSFSESLGAASKSAHEASQNEHAQSASGAKRSKDTTAAAKAHVKHSEEPEEVAATTQLQTGTNTNPRSLVLPTQLGSPAEANDDAQIATEQESTQTLSGVDTQATQPQGNSWIGLNGPAAWSPQSLTIAQTSKSTDPRPVDLSDADGSDNASDSAQPVPVHSSSTENIATSNANDVPNERHGDATDTLPSAVLEAGNPVKSTNLSAQLPNTAASASTSLNVPPPIASAATKVTGASALKGNAALKSVQSLGDTQKTAGGVTNIHVAGAKETDSYLSIQKEAKTQATDSADDNTLGQRASHVDVSQQPLPTPVTVNAQSHAALAPITPAQNSPALIEAQSGALKNAQPAPSEASLDRTVTTTETPSSAMASAVVNSAKLLQSIGQSEMRVGMRTSEFGDISIRTSSTRDSISAQISVGHDDLAKTLTAHLPEMQTRLSSGEVIDVHIHNDGRSSSYNGEFGSANQNGSNGQPQDQPSSRANSLNSYTSGQAGTAAISASVIASTAASSGRLDVRA